METLYLRAESEEALIKALSFARYEYGWIEASHEFSLDIIGILDEDTTGWPVNKDGVLLSPVKHLPGFHANIKCTDKIVAMIPVSIVIPTPDKPRRKWLGD